ncbi:DNA binding (plasmid) [Vibrio sp. B1REV9]|uniref:ParB family protein n=1 Tax=Vibrio sp. B1REV9 TaxID=2751179 RepID=UPI001AECAB31|nr:ParB family protein [Vibrio sp. B1REV9]CAE6960711.1 DNA binding [Vibrio sp. B1REV9]
MLRPQDKRTGFMQGNQLGKRSDKESVKKTFTFASGKQATAIRVVVQANELESKTAIHRLNPRRQASLTIDAVRDILPTIQAEGVHTEGVAIKDEQGIYQLLDSSRRRFSCIHAQKELPLWVLDGHIEEEDLVAFIQTTQAVKRLSYRELGTDYQAIMNNNGFTKLDELAQLLGIGRETCRKRYAAAMIDQQLIDIFPDCEGIPNGFYAKLAKVEKQLVKEERDLANFVAELGKVPFEPGAKVEEQQKQMLALMESKLQGKANKLTWKTEPLATFSDKNTYAKVSRSSDKRGLKIELSRLSPGLYEDIIGYITDKVKSVS